MPRYINAERMPSDKFWEDLTDKEKSKVLNYLLASPTVDVEEIRHGEWIKRGWDIYCSECNEEGLCNWFGAPVYSKRCPNCGARMDEKESK